MKNNKTALMILSASMVLAAPFAFAQSTTSAQAQTDAGAAAQVDAAHDQAAAGAEAQGAMQAQSTTQAMPPTGDASQAMQGEPASGERKWSDLDGDGNGSLSAQEAASMPSLAKIFTQADVDANGELTQDEYKTWLAANGGAKAEGESTGTP